MKKKKKTVRKTVRLQRCNYTYRRAYLQDFSWMIVLCGAVPFVVLFLWFGAIRPQLPVYQYADTAQQQVREATPVAVLQPVIRESASPRDNSVLVAENGAPQIVAFSGTKRCRLGVHVTVKSGDTVSEIAKQYGVPPKKVHQILLVVRDDPGGVGVAKIPNINKIHPGMVLAVPVSEPVSIAMAGGPL